MTSNPVIDALLFAGGVIISMLIAAGEVALDAVSRARLEELAEEGRHRASTCLRLKAEQESVRGAVQIATTFILFLTAFIGAYHLDAWMASLELGSETWWLHPATRIGVAVMTAAVMTGLSLVLISLFAKALGSHYPERVALRSAPLLHLLTRLFRIPQRLLTLSANMLLRPSGHTAQFSDAVMSEENIMDMLEEGTKAGVLDKTEHELIESILSFTDKTAREIMIPRKDVVAVDYEMAPGAILERVVQEGFTRMPVYRGSLDNIIGVIYAKDVVSLIEHQNIIILQDIIRPPFFVPDTKPISDLLRDFQRKRIHLAVVVDEFGGTEGIITLEDILEEIVGDIRDEYDEESRTYDMLPDGIEVEGRMTISDFNDVAPFAIPESDEYDTVGGFITKVMGRIPEGPDRASWHAVEIEILIVNERRIERARLTRAVLTEE
ncbi:MAG: HlyC/CorC family transporter [Ignavibacteriae bacterium]|nr:HlyC/CorC family transporter [Ignavibacteriota bacterium]